MRNTKLLLSSLLLAASIHLTSGQIHAGELRQIAPYEPIFQDIIYLQSQGYLLTLSLSTLPVVERDVIEALQSDLETGIFFQMSKTDSLVLLRLTRELDFNPDMGTFPEESQKLMKFLKKIAAGFGLTEKKTEEKFTIGINTEDWLRYNDGKTDLNPGLRTRIQVDLGRIFIYNTMVVDPNAPEEPRYIGKEWRGLAGYTEEAYISLRSRDNRLGINLGRQFIAFNPGFTGKLHFSWDCRPMDMVSFFLKAGPFHFTSIAARLDNINGNNRFLSAHRLEFSLPGKLILGVTESILYGGSGKGPELAYLNPFVFYHALQLNGPGDQFTGNTIGSIDFSLFLKNRLHFYGTLMIDDIQLDKKVPGDLEPNEIGFQIGLEKGGLFQLQSIRINLEYTLITNRTYKTPNPYERFTHREVPIGYYLGNDFDHFQLLIQKYLLNWRLGFKSYFIRKGEGDIFSPWDQPWMDFTVEEGYSEPFPTGIVEHRRGFEVSVSYLPDYRKQFYFAAGVEKIKNADHVKGKSESSSYFKLGIWLDWNSKLPF